MKKFIHGFTLIELMITVAIVGILAAIAYPSYLNQVRKSRRSEARSALLQAANRQERYYTTQYEYTDRLAKLAKLAKLGINDPLTENKFYKLQIDNADTKNSRYRPRRKATKSKTTARRCRSIISAKGPATAPTAGSAQQLSSASRNHEPGSVVKNAQAQLPRRNTRQRHLSYQPGRPGVRSRTTAVRWSGVSTRQSHRKDLFHGETNSSMSSICPDCFARR